MMNLKRYPKYKDSGVPWLGEIPSHWEVKRLKNLASIKNGLDYKYVQADEGYPVIGSGGIFAYATDYLYEGESVLLGRKGTIDKPLYVNGAFWTVDTMYYTYILETTYPKYLYYSVLTIDFGKYATNTALPSMTQTALSNIKFAVPKYEEQQSIANFLDKKLNHIDTLIDKQEKLIDKLAEQRSAVITHAVTKGLDPNVPMKDSGVEWLGEIPEHWAITSNKYLFNFSRGLTITKSDLIDEGIPCVNYGEVHSKYGFEVDPTIQPLKCVPESYAEDFEYAVLKQGDFIFADTSEDYEGSGNFTHLSSDVFAVAGYHTVVMKQKGNQNYRFLAYMFDSESFRTQVKTQVSGVKVFSITQNILKNTLVWLPPRAEQDKIVEYLDDEVNRVDQLRESTKKIIAKLKEYRSALITQAVTGKIDVRDMDEETKGVA